MVEANKNQPAKPIKSDQQTETVKKTEEATVITVIYTNIVSFYHF